MKTLNILTIVTLTIFLGCGSSGGGDDSLSLRILSPAGGEQFSPGASVPYELEVGAVMLMEPGDPSAHLSTMNASGEMDEHMMEIDEGAHSTDDYQGHYHVYLDDKTGTDEHLTAWTKSGVFKLPDDIVPGLHSLRFELRDNQHVPYIGIEDTVVIEVR